MTSHNRFLTVRETAERLGVSHDTVERLIRSGALVVIDVSGRGNRNRCIRVSEAALDAFVTSRIVPAASA